tara:strand:+ start:774 stop:1412 length:639 start_codon:yes stop_codon:yes gene_type:complete
MPEYRSNPPSHNTGVGDILNDVDKDEKLGGSIQSNRGTERSTHGPFLAIQNFFETQQEISDLYNKKLDMVDVVANEVGFWNEETCNFNMDWNDYQFRANEAKEADIKDNPKPLHTIHTNNLNASCFKWSAIVNCSSRDDIQGGELIFRDWQPPFRRDNYGKPIGDEKSCQPPWINELGTLIIFPSIAAWGYHLVVSGGFKRVNINFRGPSFK